MADYRVCDGQILMYSLQFLGTPIKEKISGSDFLPTFYQYHKNNPNIKMFLLGAGPESLKKLRKILTSKWEERL